MLKRNLARIFKTMLFAAACVGMQPASAADFKAQQSLIFAGEGTASINPLLNSHDELPNLIFSGLLKYDALGNPVPDLCESVSWDPQTLTYTFKLRSGVQWHDGAPFTSADVRFTYEKLCFDQTLLAPVKSNYRDIAAIKAPDDLTFQVTLSRPNAAMPGYFTVGILPEHLLSHTDLNTAAFNQAPVGTGRYVFSKWDRAGGRIMLTRNEHYYGKVPAIPAIVYCTVADEGLKSVMLTTGEADLAWLNAAFAQQFRHRPGFKNYDFPSADFRALSMDFHTPFWQRNADSIAVLNYALNKDLLVQSVLSGRGLPAFSPIQLHPAGGSKEADLYPYDLEKFAAEMARLGWVKGADGIYARGGERFSFTIQVRDYELERVDLAAVTARMLQEAGVEMRVIPVTRFDWAQGYNGYLSGFAAPFDPDQFFSAFVTGQSDNNMGYSNQEVDALLAAARAELDPHKRRALYQRFEQVFAQDPALVPLVYLEGNYVSIKGVSGLDPTRILGHHAVGVFWNVEDWTLDKGAAQ